MCTHDKSRYQLAMHSYDGNELAPRKALCGSTGMQIYYLELMLASVVLQSIVREHFLK